MEFFEVVSRRRMRRNFTDEPVDHVVLQTLLAWALRAPSAGNTQGRDLLVLVGPEETQRFWRVATDEAWRERSRRFPGMAKAPVVVLPFSHEAAYRARYAEADKPGGAEWVVPYWHVDTAYAVMTLLLGATEAGLGAAFLGNFRNEDALKEEFGVPHDRSWFGAVLLGHPDEPDPPSTSLSRPRRNDGIHWGQWATSP